MIARPEVTPRTLIWDDEWLTRFSQVSLRPEEISRSRSHEPALLASAESRSDPATRRRSASAASGSSRCDAISMNVAAASQDSLDEALLRDVLRVAEAAGREAAALVKARLGADVIKSKASRGDLLTAVDGEVEQLIEERVRAAFPSHDFLGEESVPAGAKASA